MKSPEAIREFADDITTDPVFVRRNQIFHGIDRLVALEWDIPAEAKNIPGLHKMVRPDPAENITIATNSVAGSQIQVHIDPKRNDEGNKRLANQQEQMVKWWLEKLDRRDEGSVIEKIANSAFRYNMVAFRTDHVKYVNRATTKLKTGIDELQRQEYLSQGGPFGWHVYHPACVYPLFSGLGLECVLLAEVKPAHKVLSYYGSAAKKLETKLKTNMDKDQKWKFKWVTEFYYCDREQVYCWVVPSETMTPQLASSKDGVDILKEKNDLGFLRWVVKVSTTNDKVDNIRPMLYNTWKSGWSESQNLIETLAMTTFIQNAGKPDWKLRNSSGDNLPKIDYEHLVGGLVIEPMGAELTETQPAQIDQALVQQSERLASWQERTGASRALVGKVTGDTYAGQNLQVGQGESTTESGKKLIEAALSAGSLQFFQWAVLVDEELTVPGRDRNAPKLGYKLDPKTIDIGSMYLSVTLKEGKPGANIQTVNAMTLAKSLGVSNETAMEIVGFENPQGEMRRSNGEMLSKVRVENQIMIEQARAQAEARLIMAEAEMQVQEMMMQGQQPQPPPPQDMMGMPPEMMMAQQQPMQALTPSALPDLEQGLNANAGGVPPALLNPNATRETQTGVDAYGNPV